MFVNNFGKCGPIFKILSPMDLYENFLCILFIEYATNAAQ